MEYIYSALLLHSAKAEINESNVSKVLEAAGLTVDSSKVKALVASLKDINIEEAISKAAMPVAAAAAPVAAASGAKEEKKEAPKEVESAAEGLGALFG